jgi:HD-GYP domain-containing protein (c-di-GMP phosphodiesterase class II)
LSGPPTAAASPASLHRRLALRLFLVALAVSAVLAGLVILRQGNIVRTAALADAQTRAGLIAASLSVHPDGPPGGLDGLLASVLPDTGTDTGHFIYLRATDAAGRVLSKASHDSEGSLEQFRSAVGEPGPALRASAGEGAAEWRIIADRPYLEVSLPVAGRDGAPAVHLQGWFTISPGEERQAATAVALAVAAAVGTVFLTALVLYPVLLRLLRSLDRTSADLRRSHLEVLRALGSAIAERDSDTDLHNFRVTVYSVRLAEALGLDDSDVRSLIKGALLHDVGKIGVRDHVLLKPGRLDRAEFEEMKLHVGLGLDIVERSTWLADAHPVVRCHHEKVDGTGYPDGLGGDDIPLLARIFAIADVFDALTSRRPYKEPLSHDESVSIMREGRGTHFDPRLLDTFTGLSQSLFDTYARDESGLAREEVSRLIDRYFAAAVRN